MNNAVQVNNVSMRFNLHKEKIDNIKEYLIRMVKRTIYDEEFWALENVSFALNKGDSLALIGRNGSGKSTLLKLLAGVMKPTKGAISVCGNIAPLIELGAGFDAELTAKENIFLNGAVLGYSKADLKCKYDEILEFSELEDFVDVPVKNFSSGMYARLGFSIATAVKPDIILVDEILSVGDFKFQEKCRERMYNMLQGGTTLLFVSHNKEEVLELCERSMWLENGIVKMYGDSPQVYEAYLES